MIKKWIQSWQTVRILQSGPSKNNLCVERKEQKKRVFHCVRIYWDSSVKMSVDSRSVFTFMYNPREKRLYYSKEKKNFCIHYSNFAKEKNICSYNYFSVRAKWTKTPKSKGCAKMLMNLTCDSFLQSPVHFYFTFLSFQLLRQKPDKWRIRSLCSNSKLILLSAAFHHWPKLFSPDCTKKGGVWGYKAKHFSSGSACQGCF